MKMLYTSLLRLTSCILFLLIWSGCGKKPDPTPKTKSPALGTTTIADVKPTTAKATCSLQDVGFGADGNSTITEYGICYGLKDNPTTADTKLAVGKTTTAALDIVADLTGLAPATPYFVRGYAIYEGGTTYGEQAKFTTDNLKGPDVSTGDAADFTTTTFTITGKLTSLGTSGVTQFGHVLSATNQAPTTADSKTEMGGATAAPRDFRSSFVGLKANTTYYVRAYATNVTDTGYGEMKTVKTTNEQPPTVTTGDVSNVTPSAATVGMNITAVGTNSNIQAGVCWSSSNQNPTTADAKTSYGANATQFFSNNLTGLQPNTTYYVRAYATSGVGTGYGEVKSFKTANATPPSVDTRPTPNFYTNPNLGSTTRITLLADLTSMGSNPVTEAGFVVNAGSAANPTVESNTLQIVSNSVLNASSASVFGGDIPASSVAKLQPNNNFRAYVKTSAGVYYGSNRTFAYDFPPEFSNLKFNCNSESFTVTRYGNSKYLVELGVIEIVSTNCSVVTPNAFPTTTAGYTYRTYRTLTAVETYSSNYVFQYNGSNTKIQAGAIASVCGTSPWRLIIPYAKAVDGTVYYLAPVSIKPVASCFIDCTVK